MKPLRTFIHQNGIKLVLNAEKPIYDLTKGKLARNRFLSSVNVDYIGTNVKIVKETNHAGGILGGISDGSDIILRAHFKPTPSIYKEQKTVNKNMEEITINIGGRHDPIIVPRAVVVVECMTALTVLDLLMENMTSKMDYLKKIYISNN